jgi:predicted  nucleic acid-binding Zn-ribbon protein
VGALALNLANAHPQLHPELSALQYSLSNLQNMSSYDDLVDDIQDLDADLKHAINLLESARDKGFRYQKDLDDMAHKAASAWQSIFESVMQDTRAEAQAVQSTLNPLTSQVSQLNSRLNNPTLAHTYLRSTQSLTNNLMQDISGKRRQITSRYADIEASVYKLTARLNVVHWALGQLSEAKFSLGDREDIVMAVKARWDQEGDDDPEGVLYLSNKRLVFERKETVATKKILFITTEKELVQEVLFAEDVKSIKENKAQGKGLFGHQDFLEVDFGGKLKKVSLHLEGQESQDWSGLLDAVRSGKIEEDRAVEGGLSFSDLTGEINQADIVEIQSEVNELQDELMLMEPRAELEELENEVRMLERELGDLRARGYAIEKDLEGDIAILAAQWDRIKTNATKTLDLQAELLKAQSQSISNLMTKLAGLSGSLGAARPVYMQLKSALASVEAQEAAALETIYGQFDDYAAEVEGLGAHLDWVDWMLDALSTASFKLLSTESGVAATEAVYARPGMEEENGILYLTDQRLLWEDRVEEYEIKVEVAIAQVENVSVEVTTDEEGEEDEFLVFKFSGGAPIHEARFDISSPVGEAWVKMVGRARNGDYTVDRAVELDPAELERIRNVPTTCPNCGAQLGSPVFRGQTEITCEFCSVVTRI